MIGVVLCSHGALASALLDVAEMMLGRQERVLALALQAEDSPESLATAITDARATLDDGDGVLLLVDLFGGSPFNAAAPLLRGAGCEVVTGVNLPMVVEVLTRRGDLPPGSLAALAAVAEEAGRQGIRDGRSALGL